MATANNPQEDIQKLINSIASAPKRPAKAKLPAGRRPQGQEQKSFLYLGLATIILGFGYITYDSLSSSGRGSGGPPEDDPEPAVAGAQQQGASGGQGSLAGAGGSGGATGEVAYGQGSLRPANFVPVVDGKILEMGAVSALKFPDDNRPFDVYILMYAQLDLYTTKMWAQAGLFRNEGAPLSSFLRRVTITEETSSLLHDWHVEGVCPAQ